MRSAMFLLLVVCGCVAPSPSSAPVPDMPATTAPTPPGDPEPGPGVLVGSEPDPASAEPVAATAAALPAVERLVLADFESGPVPKELLFFVNNQYNAGRYSWAIDGSQGAAGSRRSLRFDVNYGAPYFYFDQSRVGAGRYTARGKKVNRLSFWIKLPKDWGQKNNPYYNLHVGWYLSNSTTTAETDNGHYYTMLYAVPDGEWTHVVMADNYTWQRGQADATFDPGRSSHLQAFPSFWDRVTRFYITGAPNPGNFLFYPKPYKMWVDQIELLWQDEVIAASPRKVESRVGVSTDVALTNAGAEAMTIDVKVTKLSGPLAAVLDAQGATVTSLRVEAGATKRLRVKPTGVGVSNVVFYPHGGPQSAAAQNRTLACRYRGSFDQPGAAVLVIGK